MDVGGGAAGGNADEHIGSAEAPGFQVGLACLLQVFEPFGAAQQGRRPPGQHALHQLGRRTKGGRTFGRIQHAQAARGASPQIEEPAALGQPFGNGVDGRRQGWGRRRHGLLGPAVFLAEELHQISGGELVEVGAELVGLLGEQMAPVVTLEPQG